MVIIYNYYKNYPLNYSNYRTPTPKPPIPPPPKPNNKKPPKKKFNFKTLKKDTCNSLNDVECFLNNFTSNLKYYRLIKLLK